MTIEELSQSGITIDISYLKEKYPFLSKKYPFELLFLESKQTWEAKSCAEEIGIAPTANLILEIMKEEKRLMGKCAKMQKNN